MWAINGTGPSAETSAPWCSHNVIKRIGDYKMAVISSNPVTVNYSVEGVPNTVAIRDPGTGGTGPVCR